MSQLHTQLTQIESYANILEKRVYQKLCALELAMNETQIHQQEKDILALLHRLDELQDEADSITAKLKESGEHVSVSYKGNVYRAKPKKLKAPPKPKAERKPRKQYPVESPTPDKLKAKKEAEKKAAQEARAAARTEATKLRQAQREEEAKALREARKAAKEAQLKLKPKPAPKPKKKRESYEVRLAKKRRDNVLMRLANLDSQIEREHKALLKRLEERKARVREVAYVPVEQLGYQKRRNAQLALENVQGQLDGLEQRKLDRFDSLTAQYEQVEKEIAELLANESASQTNGIIE